MTAENAEFTVAVKWQRIPVITELIQRPAGPPLRDQPGQYVLLGDPDAELAVRSYSIANAQRREGMISLLVSRVPGGQLSSRVHAALRPGDRVLLSGPHGSFTVSGCPKATNWSAPAATLTRRSPRSARVLPPSWSRGSRR